VGLSRRDRRLLAAGALAAALGAGAACSSLAYTAQALAGGARILLARRPIERALARGDLDAEAESKLRAIARMREFAAGELALPVGGAYASYAEIGRDVVTWNVVATPELAVDPVTWCFPVAGCVSYRGYFREARARRFAARLAARGLDVTITEAIAYSSLGWFDDPVLDTFLALPEWQLAGLLFHELAHRAVYARSDTAFNESYATAVEELGLERWLAARGDAAEVAVARAALAEERTFDALRLRARDELAALYRSPASDAEKRAGKRRILSALSAEHRRLRATGELGPRFDAWLAREPNNADLAAVADYAQWLPAMRELFARGDGFAALHAAARELADLTRDERRARLAELEAASRSKANETGATRPGL
jgi:predicted aminopeptidase